MADYGAMGYDTFFDGDQLSSSNFDGDRNSGVMDSSFDGPLVPHDALSGAGPPSSQQSVGFAPVVAPLTPCLG